MTEIQFLETFLNLGPGILGTLSLASRDLACEGWLLLLLIINFKSVVNI